jgi:uncharacterized protein YndB with AHSA1/START domain
MTKLPVAQATFTIKRVYPGKLAGVFEARASPATKSRWLGLP